MDQKTILTGLVNALQNGTGDLSDLEQLLDRAKADVATAKKEKAEAEARAKKEAENAKRKYAEQIANMATRVLNDETTEEDLAMVMQSYLKAQGIEATVSAKDITDGMQASKELRSALDELVESFASLLEDDAPKAKPAKKNADTNTDDALDEFLKSIGLR